MDVRQIVLDVMEQTEIADPGVLSSLVMRRIPEERSREALHAVILTYVRGVVTRSNTPICATPPDNVVQFEPASRPSHGPRVPRDKAAVTQWQAMLRNRISTESGYKFLRNCDYDDLTFAADLRANIAEANMTQAKKYYDLRDELKKFDVATVGELPPNLEGYDDLDAA